MRSEALCEAHSGKMTFSPAVWRDACCTRNILDRRESEYKSLGWERAGCTRRPEVTLRWPGSGKVREGFREQVGSLGRTWKATVTDKDIGLSNEKANWRALSAEMSQGHYLFQRSRCSHYWDIGLPHFPSVDSWVLGFR